MKKWISHPLREGRHAAQAHADFPEGTFEREAGREGFFGPAAHFYHTHPPTGWVDFEGPGRPRAFDLTKLGAMQASPWKAASVLQNAHVKLRYWYAGDSMDHLVRNADGDELLFVHRGRGELFCDYGHLSFEPGDYILLPRGTMWRAETSEPLAALLIEATNSAYQLPEKGILGPHAIFDPGVLAIPQLDEAFVAQQGDVEWKVLVKRQDALSTITYPFNPLDAVGWKGELAVCRLNIRDIRPLMSHRYHVPPSAHSTFVADRFVVCTFCPRPFESDPGALKVPFFHNNDDYDEVLFYHAGDFFSRDNIHPGMMTFHPSGFTHGPHPKALARMFKQEKPMTDEYAVMVDARDPLDVESGAQEVEWADYAKSWRTDESADADR